MVTRFDNVLKFTGLLSPSSDTGLERFEAWDVVYLGRFMSGTF
jgi:hypothetical protein